MEFLLSRYFWVLNVTLVIGTGYALARAGSSYVEHEVLKVPVVEEKGEPEELDLDEDEGLRRPGMDRSVGLDRRKELMRSGEPQEAKVEMPVEPPPTDNLPEEQAPPEEMVGSLDLEFMAAITTTDDKKNIALVRVDGGMNRWVGIGDQLKTGYEVSHISNYYISVSQGVTELLWKKKEPAEAKGLAGRGGPMGPPGADRGGPMPAPGSEAKKPVQPPKTPYTEGVKQIGPFEYNIDRGMLNEQLQDLAKLGREARVIPNYDRDTSAYKGFKLIGVRPNSLYRAIGIRSGDVIMQINGEELNSPGKALELFTKLQNSSGITLDIMRRGQKQTLNYKIE